MLRRANVDGFVGTPVDVQIGLSVSLQVQGSQEDTASTFRAGSQETDYGAKDEFRKPRAAPWRSETDRARNEGRKRDERSHFCAEISQPIA
jgi:hypothetical protein